MIEGLPIRSEYRSVTLADFEKLPQAKVLPPDAVKAIHVVGSGPSMSATPGKIRILGVSEIRGDKVYVLSLLQGRNSDWISRPFFAKYDPMATWIDDLKPAFGESEFFYEAELREMLRRSVAWPPQLQEAEENTV